MSEHIPNLKEIRDVLVKAMKDSPHYTIGSPTALQHLAAHVAAAVDEMDRRLRALEERA